MLIITPPFFIKPKLELLKKQLDSMETSLSPSQNYVLKRSIIRTFLAQHHAFRVYISLNSILWGIVERYLDLYAQKSYFDQTKTIPN